MEVVYRCCCGIDVHKKIIAACLVNGGEQVRWTLLFSWLDVDLEHS